MMTKASQVEGQIVHQQTTAIATVEEIRSNVQTIQQVMKEVMKQDVHYGRVPGCDKPMLLKPGAEKIFSTFRIGVEPVIEDLSDGFDIRYRVTARAFYIPTGQTLGAGVGEASSKEKKYAWREAVCQEEFDECASDRKQEYWKKGYKGNKPSKVFQIRANPSDIANTILKMAKKRAMTDVCLQVTACSDIFDQDLDEDHVREAVNNSNAVAEETTVAPPQPQPEANPNVISEAQRKRLWAIMQNGPESPESLAKYLSDKYQVESTYDIPKSIYEAVCNWAAGQL